MASRLLELAYESIRQKESNQQPESVASLDAPPSASSINISPTPKPSHPQMTDPSGYSARYRQTKPEPKPIVSKTKEEPRPRKAETPSRRSASPRITTRSLPKEPTGSRRKSAPRSSSTDPRKDIPLPEQKHPKEPPTSSRDPSSRDPSSVTDKDEAMLNHVQNRIEAFESMRRQTNSLQQYLADEQSSLESLFKDILYKWSQERADFRSEIESLRHEVKSLNNELENERNRRVKTEDVLEQTKTKCSELVHQLGSSLVNESHSSFDHSTSSPPQNDFESEPQPQWNYSYSTPQNFNNFQNFSQEFHNRDDLIEAIKSELLKDKPPKADELQDDHPIQLIESLRKRLDAEQLERLKTEEQTASMLAAEERTIALLEAKLRSLESQLCREKVPETVPEKEEEQVVNRVEEVVEEQQHEEDEEFLKEEIVVEEEVLDEVDGEDEVNSEDI
ncbi:hypothetical protein GEMRC1_005031 [Eukaryota sp. GEM-RC1]